MPKKGSTNPKRPYDQRTQNIAYTTRRLLQGIPPKQIVEELHEQGWTTVTYDMVQYDIHQVRLQWKRSTAINFAEIRNRELTKIDVLEQEYWDAWEKSKEPRERRRTKRTVIPVAQAPPAQRDEAAVETEHRDGNPFFLAGIQWCIETRTRMLGLEAPSEMDRATAAGRPLIPIEVLQARRQAAVKARQALAQLGRTPMLGEAIEGESYEVNPRNAGRGDTAR